MLPTIDHHQTDRNLKQRTSAADWESVRSVREWSFVIGLND